MCALAPHTLWSGCTHERQAPPPSSLKNYALQISILSDNIISNSMPFVVCGALRVAVCSLQEQTKETYNVIGNNIELFCNLPKQQRQRIRWISTDKNTEV